MMAAGALSGLAEEPTVVNRQDSFVLQLAAESGMSDDDNYLAALHVRPEGYDPASVLISGILYAPKGMEILKATVECGSVYEVSGSDILRLQTDFRPEKVNELRFEPDLDRSAFALVVDLSGDNPADGIAEAKVTLTLINGQEISLDTKVNIQASKGRFYDVTRAVRDQAMALNDMGEPLEKLQSRLLELHYLNADQVSGVCDQVTMDAANRLLADKGLPQSTGFISAEALGAIESDDIPAAPKTDFLSQLKGNTAVLGTEIPLWLLIAAAAALVVLVVGLVLLTMLKKRKKNGRQNVPDAGENELPKAYITSPDTPGAQILTIGDEPTMDLNGPEEQGVVFGADEPTTDLNEPEYTVKVRMIFQDVFLDREAKLTEGGQAVIGRSSEAVFQTNPADTSISHKHGIFTASQGMITYQDESRNGTRYNGQRTIHKDEKVTIPLNTKVQLEMGSHIILVLALRNG